MCSQPLLVAKQSALAIATNGSQTVAVNIGAASLVSVAVIVVVVVVEMQAAPRRHPAAQSHDQQLPLRLHNQFGQERMPDRAQGAKALQSHLVLVVIIIKQ